MLNNIMFMLLKLCCISSLASRNYIDKGHMVRPTSMHKKCQNQNMNILQSFFHRKYVSKAGLAILGCHVRNMVRNMHCNVNDNVLDVSRLRQLPDYHRKKLGFKSIQCLILLQSFVLCMLHL